MSLRSALDSEVALIAATTLHTLGAIGVVAALGTHLAWYRSLRRGQPSQRLHTVTFWLTINSIVANLVGGFMRTYLPGHPGIADAAESPWVQVMLMKHTFIFAALGALIYLHHWVAPRLLQRSRDGRLAGRTPTDHALAVVVVLAGVVGASVLGAIAQITPLGEAFEDHDADAVHEVEDPMGRTVRYQNITGTITTLPPLAAQEPSGTFEVPRDFVRLEATLVWSDPAWDLDLQVEAQDPDATGNAGGFFGGGAGRAEAVIDGPSYGTWRYRVLSDAAVNVAWELVLRMSTVADHETFLAETVTVSPGSFFEINTEMPEGATFWWAWTSSAPVHFDVHSHFDDEVQYHEEMTASEHEGSFTNEREGGYSFLWANEGQSPVSLTYRVWGEFEVDSYFPPR